jgi:hypothetical protein
MSQEEDDDQEQRLINEGRPESKPDCVVTQTVVNAAPEYKTWKKNSPFLYDMILR